MSDRGVVLRADDEEARQWAARHRLPVEIQAAYDLPWERTLFLDSQVGRVSWGLLPRGFDFLARWEAAAPVWSYETLAADVATGPERERTQALVGDLRVPLYETGLLFVRDCEGGRALLKAWQAEDGEPRLAFLRALYRVKPLFLALPRSWLVGRAVTPGPRGNRVQQLPSGLVRVKVGPARYVRCQPGEEQAVIERYTRQGRR
jgi:hypothetical protein